MTLAVLGGQPAFSDPLHVGKPQPINRARLHQLVDHIVDSSRLTNDGPCVQLLEAQIASRFAVADCVAVTNATVAIELLVRALGLTGEIIVPAFTFIATAHAVQWQGLRPVFCDISPTTQLVDLESAQRLVNEKTSAILATTLWGQLSNAQDVVRFAERNDIVAIFDSAHSFDCKYDGRWVGSHGAAEVLSFHATKAFTSGEGGAVLTNDVDLASQLRLLRNFGIRGLDTVLALGTNAKLPELSAALGLANLDEVGWSMGVNRRNHEIYAQRLTGRHGMSVLDFRDHESHNFQYVVVDIPPSAGLSRDDLLDVLWAENVWARRYFYPGCHRSQPYLASGECAPVPNTDDAVARTLVLPTGPQLSIEGVHRVCDVILAAHDNSEEVRTVLRQKRHYPAPPDSH